MDWLGFFVLAFVALQAWRTYTRYCARRAWERFADEHDFELLPLGVGEYEMSGTYKGVEARVDVESQDGENSSNETVCSASLPDEFPSELIVVEKELSFGLERISAQDIQVGAPDVDEAFVFRSDHPSEVHSFFDRPGVADAFRGLARASGSLHDDQGSVRIEEGTVRVAFPSIETEEDHIAKGLDAVTRFVRDIEEALQGSADTSSADGPAPETGSDPAGSGDDSRSETAGDEPAEDPFDDEEFVVEW